jgi:hypothetical protein
VIGSRRENRVRDSTGDRSANTRWSSVAGAVAFLALFVTGCSGGPSEAEVTQQTEALTEVSSTPTAPTDSDTGLPASDSYQPALPDFIRAFDDASVLATRDFYLDRYEPVSLVFLVAVNLGSVQPSSTSFTAFSREHLSDYPELAKSQLDAVVQIASDPQRPAWIEKMVVPTNQEEAEVTCRLAYTAAESVFTLFSSSILGAPDQCPIRFAEYRHLQDIDPDAVEDYLGWITAEYFTAFANSD